jgi:hypothetical protein
MDRPHWTKSVPWWLGWLFVGSFGIAGAFGSTVLPKAFQLVAFILGCAGMAIAAGGTILHFVNERRLVRNLKTITVEPSYLISFGLIVAIAGVVWQWQRGSAPPVMANPQPSAQGVMPNVGPFTKNQIMRRYDFASSEVTKSAVSYTAEYSVTGKHLRAFLEYQSADFGVVISPNRVQLADLRDFVKGTPLVIPVVSRIETDSRVSFSFGAYENQKPILFIGNYRARIRLIDDDGTEQRYYFLLTGGSAWDTRKSGGTLIPYPDVVDATNLDFARNWEAFDGQP